MKQANIMASSSKEIFERLLASASEKYPGLIEVEELEKRPSVEIAQALKKQSAKDLRKERLKNKPLDMLVTISDCHRINGRINLSMSLIASLVIVGSTANDLVHHLSGFEAPNGVVEAVLGYNSGKIDRWLHKKRDEREEFTKEIEKIYDNAKEFLKNNETITANPAMSNPQVTNPEQGTALGDPGSFPA
jgi:hypothetical protein